MEFKILLAFRSATKQLCEERGWKLEKVSIPSDDANQTFSYLLEGEYRLILSKHPRDNYYLLGFAKEGEDYSY